MRDTNLVVSDIDKNLTESCSEGANNQFLNLFIKCWAGFNEISLTFEEQIQKKIDLVRKRLNTMNEETTFPKLRSNPRKIEEITKYSKHSYFPVQW